MGGMFGGTFDFNGDGRLGASEHMVDFSMTHYAATGGSADETYSDTVSNLFGSRYDYDDDDYDGDEGYSDEYEDGDEDEDEGGGDYYDGDFDWDDDVDDF